jgi:beta-glucanase (GH16 family)
MDFQVVVLAAAAFMSIDRTVFAGTNTFNERSVKQWLLKGPLTNAPLRKTELLPLSDQENKARWIKVANFSDEFEGVALDTNKWTVGMAWWGGRQPAWFSASNVVVRNGQLHLMMRKEPVPEQLKDRGYHDYTSAALHAKTRCGYGYYEVKARPMNSGGSSSFWFQNVDQSAFPKWSTEIDVFELCGKSAMHDRRDYMTVHLFSTPDEKRHWQIGAYWESPKRLAEDFHVFGFEWDPAELRWFVDGALVRTVQNTHWHQPLFLTFDSETMPEWFGMPNDKDLPSTFSAEYVRAWTRKGAPRL